MIAKLGVLVGITALVAVLLYGANRLSTQWHPEGNWIIAGLFVLAVLCGAAAVWDYGEGPRV